jgi:predicted phage terminase large subunit-like protein
VIPASIRAQAELELRNRRKIIAPALTFRAFVDQVNPRYQWYTHCRILADVLQRVADGELRRVMVFMPPRHGKSELVSRLFSAYYLYRHPDRFVGVNSYAADLAYTFSRSARDNYQRSGRKLRDDAAAVKHWMTDQDGGLWAAGVGGPITGKGFHLGIIDDPLKNAEEAQSETIRAKQKEWYESTFYTREEAGDDTAIVIVQTRWHEDDLSGYLLDKEADEPEHWTVVNLPAIAEADPPTFPLSCDVVADWRKPGDPLCPERYPLKRLLSIAARIGQYFWHSLFQQRPSTPAGDFFNRAWFPIVPLLPYGCSFVRYWDLASSDSLAADYTAGILMARDTQGYYYVVDVVHGRWTAHERASIIKQTAALDRVRAVTEWLVPEPSIYIEQAPGLAQEPTHDLVRQLAGYVVYADRVTKDKQSRATPFQAQAQAGNVKLIAGAWNKSYLDELTSFPTGKHDDRVDGSSGAFNKLAEGIGLEYGENPLDGYRG